MVGVLFFIVFCGLIIFIIVHSQKKNNLWIEKRNQQLLLERTPEYKLEKLKKEYDRLSGCFDLEVKKYSDKKFCLKGELHVWERSDFVLSRSFGRGCSDFVFDYLPYQDNINNIIKQNNLTKLVCHDNQIFVKTDLGEFRIYTIDETELPSRMNYISGTWDNDVKIIFVELFKRYTKNTIKIGKEFIEKEINELQKEIELKRIASLVDIDSANDFYKNN